MAGLGCGPSISEFDSHPTPQMEDAAEGTATSLENWSIGNCRGSIPPSSSYPLEAEK